MPERVFLPFTSQLIWTASKFSTKLDKVIVTLSRGAGLAGLTSTEMSESTTCAKEFPKLTTRMRQIRQVVRIFMRVDI